ncbi:MAG: O-antigen ligase family protein, partial [Chloroflexota bacterium]
MLSLTLGAWVAKHIVKAADDYQRSVLQWQWPKLKALDWGVIGYVAIATVSLSWAALIEPALTEYRTLVIEPALFYLMLRSEIRTRDAMLRMVFVLMFAGLLMSVIGLGMYAFGAGIITAEGDARRLAGVYGSPNNVALFLGRTLPFALAYALVASKPWQRWFAIVCLVVGGGTTLLTQSVGALFIGLPVAFAVVLLLIYRRRAVVPLLLLVTLSVGMGAFLLQYPRFARVLDFTSGTNFFRLRVWESAINVIADSPIRGLGLDQFLYAFRGRYILPDAWQEPDLSHPHNWLLDFWTRLGLAGVLVFLWIQAHVWRYLVQAYRNITDHKHDLALV